ncbi:MAG: NAD(P)/FAD-dependent oxidoreductase [Planctomycetota bacterium]|nr:NAD(P)/FAD-dependent oxidoreductase [Planctomycetota bacterium]
MSETCDIAIVGFGAAGIAAGIFAGQKARETGGPAHIVALDGAKTIGAKIRVSGGTRCNVTHERISAQDYNGSKNIVRNVLAAFDAQAAMRWFEEMGVKLKREETGKLFPVSDSARSVLGALMRRCEELGVEIWTGCRVHELMTDQAGGFVIGHERGRLDAERVILATGGRSLPRSGSDGFGYELARRLGHSVTATYPALVPLVLDSAFFHAELSGVSHEVELATVCAGKAVDRRRGSLLWTHFGISGPVVMDASRHWVIGRASGGGVEMRCGLLPGETVESLEVELVRLAAGSGQSVGRWLAGRLPERVVAAVLKHLGIDSGTPLPQLPRDRRRGLVHALTGLALPVVGDRGWNYAEVTAGGVPLAEIDYRTMESRKVPGLHLVGEILDCDGRIGGFNFQWAWATGCLAGGAAGNCRAGRAL